MVAREKSAISDLFPFTENTGSYDHGPITCPLKARKCFSFCRRHERICDHLDADGLELLSSIAFPKDFWARRMLYRPRQPTDEIYLIESGLVSFAYLLADGRRQIIDFYGPGDVLHPPKERERNQISVQALNPVAALTIRGEDFRKFLTVFPEATTRLFIGSPRRTDILHQRIVTLGRKRAVERVAEFLIMIREKMGVENATAVNLPMSRTDIADYLGLTVETVSRTLAELKAGGFIKIPMRNTVLLLDPAGLAQYSLIEETRYSK